MPNPVLMDPVVGSNICNLYWAGHHTRTIIFSFFNNKKPLLCFELFYYNKFPHSDFLIHYASTSNLHKKINFTYYLYKFMNYSE